MNGNILAEYAGEGCRGDDDFGTGGHALNRNARNRAPATRKHRSARSPDHLLGVWGRTTSSGPNSLDFKPLPVVSERLYA